MALSADGNTLVSGGPNEDTMKGAFWIHTRVGTTWTEQAKFVASDTVAQSTLSFGTSMSADGSVMMCSGAYDNSFHGAVWSFIK